MLHFKPLSVTPPYEEHSTPKLYFTLTRRTIKLREIDASSLANLEIFDLTFMLYI